MIEPIFNCDERLASARNHRISDSMARRSAEVADHWFSSVPTTFPEEDVLNSLTSVCDMAEDGGIGAPTRRRRLRWSRPQNKLYQLTIQIDRPLAEMGKKKRALNASVQPMHLPVTTSMITKVELPRWEGRDTQLNDSMFFTSSPVPGFPAGEASFSNSP
jgi:hypothetical protein